MKNWKYKWYLKYIAPILGNTRKYIGYAFSIFGVFYSLAEIMQNVFNNESIITFFRDHTVITILIIILITVFQNRAILEYSSHLGESDQLITLKMSDIFQIEDSAIVIPTNTTFDTTLNDSFISENSIQGQFQKKFYGADFAELDKSLKNSLDEHYPGKYIELNDRKRTNQKRYGIGTVAKITRGKTHYYFLAVADVSKSGKPENVTVKSLTEALMGLWRYLANDGHTEKITIPVIGTGKAGLSDGTMEDMVRKTISSFILATQEKFVAKGLTICIFPQSLKTANVTWESLCRYLKLQCDYATDKEKHKKHENAPEEII